MIKNARNKMIDEAEDKGIKAEEIVVQQEGVEQEFFFSGTTEYRPRTIKAKTKEEAEKKWLLEREKVE